MCMNEVRNTRYEVLRLLQFFMGSRYNFVFQKLTFLKHKITRSDAREKYEFSFHGIYKYEYLKKAISQSNISVTSSFL